MSNSFDDCLLNTSLVFSCRLCPSIVHDCHSTTIHYGLTAWSIYLCSIETLLISVAIVCLLLGSLWNSLAIGTFYQPPTREMGTGIYRLWISIIGQVTLMIVVMHIIADKTHYEVLGCYLLEYLRQTCHALYDCLTACTTIERTVVICQGLAFNKMGSRRWAKSIVPILVVYQFASRIHEPFHRRVIVSSDRFLCIWQYSNHWLCKYQTSIDVLHFLVPYLINLFLPFVWLVALTRSKRVLYQNLSLWTNFKKVLKNYKYTMISCSTLVLLNTPRLITMLTLTCTNYAWQNTAYSIAYVFSLMPMMINMFLFVLPSPKYRPELIGFIRRRLSCRYRSC
jgi:hypothetical protein